MKIISFEDIRLLQITPEMCFDWAESAIRNKKQALLPPKISIKPSDGVFCNVMPSIVSVRTAAKGGDQSSNPLTRTYTKFAE